MWLRNDGYFMAEMLLSLSAWLIAVSFLLPFATFLIGQSIQLRQEAQATDLLYDRLQHLKLHPYAVGDSEIERDGSLYEITLSSRTSGKMEVCVGFEGYIDENSSKCALAE